MVTIAKCIWSALQWEFNHGSRIQCTNCNTRVPPWPDCWQFVLKKRQKADEDTAGSEKPFHPPTKQSSLFPSLCWSWPDFWSAEYTSNKYLKFLKQSNVKSWVFFTCPWKLTVRDIFCYEQHILPLKLGRSFTIKSRPVSSAQLKTF